MQFSTLDSCDCFQIFIAKFLKKPVVIEFGVKEFALQLTPRDVSYRDMIIWVTIIIQAILLLKLFNVEMEGYIVSCLLKEMVLDEDSDLIVVRILDVLETAEL